MFSDLARSGDVAAVSRSYAATPAGHKVRQAVLIIPGEKVLSAQLFCIDDRVFLRSRSGQTYLDTGERALSWDCGFEVNTK